MTDANIVSLSLENLKESFLQAGYRVEHLTDPVNGAPYLRSATGGLAFDIRPGNRLTDEPNRFLDAALVAVFQVQGDLSLDLVNQWNATRRFARLQYSRPFLVFSMDFGVYGGVSPAHVRGQIETWDRLVQELIAFLREELSKLYAHSGNTQASATPVAGAQPAPAAEQIVPASAAAPATIQ